MQLLILRNFLIPSLTPYLLGAKVLFGTVACHPQIYKPIQLHEIILKEMDPDVTKKFVICAQAGSTVSRLQLCCHFTYLCVA
jgi:hypothetical protein